MSRSPNVQLAWLSLAMFFGMTLWFSATAANAPIVAEFHLTTSQTAWLTMAVQGGFVIGTLLSALLNLPDIVNPRRLFAAGCVIAATANAALVRADGVVMLIALRVVTGAALAWVYPPGMKIAAGWFEQRRGAALGVLIGALTVGSAFPHLLASASATIPWRTLMLAASSLALLGGALVVTAVGDGPYVASSARFDPAAVGRVFSDRRTRLATLGYLGHMWELYAVWTWIAAFASASLGFAGGATPSSPAGSAVAFATIGSGAIGSAAAGLFADRLGKARVAELGDDRQRRLLRRRRLPVSRAGAGALSLRDRLGRGGGRRLRAAVRAGRAVQPARPRRHGAHDADVRGVPADDGVDPAAADRGAGGRLAVGVHLSRAGAGVRRPGAARAGVRCALKTAEKVVSLRVRWCASSSTADTTFMNAFTSSAVTRRATASSRSAR